jgi:hypothetical protein
LRCSTGPWRSSTACTVEIAGLCTSGYSRASRSRIVGAPHVGLSCLRAHDQVLNLKREADWRGDKAGANGPSALQAAIVVAREDLAAGLARDIELPARHRHLLAVQQGAVVLPHNGSFAAGTTIALSATPGVGARQSGRVGGLAASQMERRGFLHFSHQPSAAGAQDLHGAAPRQDPSCPQTGQISKWSASGLIGRL